MFFGVKFTITGFIFVFKIMKNKYNVQNFEKIQLRKELLQIYNTV